MPRPCAYDERARDVLEDAHRLAHRQRAARQPRAQRLALDERHDEERQAVRLARAQHRHDVRMLKRRRQHDLALEPVDRDRRGELVRQHLDDDLRPSVLSRATNTVDMPPPPSSRSRV